jgi:hypothetical protein
MFEYLKYVVNSNIPSYEILTYTWWQFKFHNCYEITDFKFDWWKLTKYLFIQSNKVRTYRSSNKQFLDIFFNFQIYIRVPHILCVCLSNICTLFSSKFLPIVNIIYIYIYSLTRYFTDQLLRPLFFDISRSRLHKHKTCNYECNDCQGYAFFIFYNNGNTNIL